MTIHHRSLIILVCLMCSVAACGVYDETADTAKTVDEAVNLLQDIEDHNAWDTLIDGLDTLHAEGIGYGATVTFLRSTLDAQGNVVAVENSLTVTLQVDAGADALIQINEGDHTRDYLVLGYGPDAEKTHIYRIETGEYVCVDGGADFDLLQGGVNHLFDVYGLEAIGIQTLAVANKTDGEMSVAGREVASYELESKVEDALRILAAFDNAALQTAVAETGMFKLSGNLYLDDKTLALLLFDGVYDDLTTQRRLTFSFEVTQWGEVADNALPVDGATIAACD